MARDTRYELRFFEADGTAISVVTEFNQLTIYREVNGVGLAEFELDGDLDFISDLEHMSIFEVWRENSKLGLDLYKEFAGFLLDPEESRINKRNYYTQRIPGLNWLLSTRDINWYAGVDDRTKFRSEKAETVLKTLVDYNIGSNATTGNDRLLTGSRTDISIQTDAAGGNTIDLNCMGDNLLETLQIVAKKGGGDFDLVNTAKNPNTFQFQWFLGQLGTDRSSGTNKVLFSELNNNLIEQRRRFNRRKEKTIFVVAGQGTGADRDIRIVQGADYAAGNHIERFIPATDIEKGDLDGLDARGEDKALEDEANPESSFEVVQTDSTYYGLHFFLGDLVAVNWFGNTETHKVESVVLSIKGNEPEVVDPELVKV